MKAALVIFGGIVVLLGLAAGVFTTSESVLFGLYTTTSTPYKDFMIPLIIGGVVIIIVGAAIPENKRKE